jgi:hypothetical protein
MKTIDLAICCLFLIGATSIAQETRDFSGTFVLTSLKGEKENTAKKLPKIQLKVIQNGNSIEVVETIDDGKTVTARYFLDGRESKNLTSGGVPTTDKAETKGQALVIRSSYRLANGGPVRETQKWELSADSRTLKIRRQTQFEAMSAMDFTMDEAYQRQ